MNSGHSKLRVIAAGEGARINGTHAVTFPPALHEFFDFARVDFNLARCRHGRIFFLQNAPNRRRNNRYNLKFQNF